MGKVKREVPHRGAVNPARANLLRHETQWLPTGIGGTEVAELEYREADLPASVRFLAIRHWLKDKTNRAGGKLLIDCLGYLYQVLVTNSPRHVSPVELWLDYTAVSLH